MPTYRVDPVSGDDANDGSSWALAFKTLKKTFAAGDTILVAKSPETAAAGTVAAVLGSTTVNDVSNSGQKVLKVAATADFRVGNPVVIGAGTARSEKGNIASIQAGVSLTLVANLTYAHTAEQGDTVVSPVTCVIDTTEDLTGIIAQYTVLRIGGDDTLYMVQAITSSIITLYRPYRGATGSGKGLTYYTGLPTSAIGDWQPVAMPGTAASRITVKGGVNPATDIQDGFTILYGNNANGNCLKGNWYFTDITRVATFYWSYGGWGASIYDSSIDLCYAFRNNSYFGYNAGMWQRTTIGIFVSELGYFGYYQGLINCTINQLETAELGTRRGIYFSGTNPSIINLIIKQWRNAGYNSIYGGIGIGKDMINVRIFDSIVDELGLGCLFIYLVNENTNLDVVFQNPTLGAGTIFNIFSTAIFTGSIKISNINGISTDQREYVGQPDSGKYAIRSLDNTVYNTAGPSAKVELFQSANPTTFNHLIPCDAGVGKTVSVYFRKNSSYGSVNRPTMRLHWMTGSEGALVSNTHDVVMPDTDDEFIQVSHAVTPSVQGAITMELIFQSANAGAIAWYDDIGVA